ncbi:MAG: Smr/MutS family protein [Candidatus Izimaplasma sp.]|nr:Smr/MutS family protein [Candidatus Izimaplasma bacterium]
MVELDVHGMTKDQAKVEIEKFIARLSNEVKEVRIIHGFHTGSVLRESIQSTHFIRSKRIKRKKLTMNRGETIFELY